MFCKHVYAKDFPSHERQSANQLKKCTPMYGFYRIFRRSGTQVQGVGGYQ